MKNLISILVVFSLIFAISGCKNTNPVTKTKYPTPPVSVDLPDGNGKSFDFLASSNGYFYRKEGDASKLFYIKGVNMGLTVPTTNLSNPNVSYETYMEWFKQIKEMNANTVRAFTVMNPNFYKAFYDFNNQNQESPLYLIQGIWFSEELMSKIKDALDSDKIIINAFKRSVTETVDIIHGNSDYTVYGEFSPAIYNKDISKYVIGYVLGLEYPAEFVIETNTSHPNEKQFSGKYLYTDEDSSPFEAFLCEVGETLIAFETESYSHQTPVAFLNWQSLDTLSHSNEPFEEEDAVSVNTENIKKTNSYVTGLFASIDAYPYYPEFMNHQKEYLDYRDENGRSDAYRAYLKDLKTKYTVPVLLAEYGLSTSRGIAHTNVGGYNQGGLTEEEQGNYNSQMTKSIALEGYCGGLLFSWQDEWFKRTWNTVMFYPDNPADRTQNLSSAEQSYGLMSFDASNVYPDGDFSDWKNKEYIDGTNMKVQYDANFMHILVDLPKGFNFKDDIYYIPISVLGIGSKQSTDDNISFNKNCDFILKVCGEKQTRLLCDEYYDVFNYKYTVLKKIFKSNGILKENSGKYNKINTFTANEMYLPMDKVTLPAQYYESGLLRYGNANPNSDNYCSQADFYYKDGKLEIRIAWYLLNVVNARLGICIKELRSNDIEFTRFSDIYIGGGQKNTISLFSAGFKPIGNIVTTPRLKRSYKIMQQAFEETMNKKS